jgi:hypothetical protein
MELWKDVGSHIAANSKSATVSNITVTVCTGSEWYQFPSHFFLPAGARLQFIQDGFGGILPQHFSPTNGTFGPPLLPFNDRNAEQVDRYVPLTSCQYLVLLVDAHKIAHEKEALPEPLSASQRIRHLLHAGEVAEGKGTKEGGMHEQLRRFRKVTSRPVISAEYSRSPLFRSFFIPTKSPQSVVFQEYALFEQNHSE